MNKLVLVAVGAIALAGCTAREQQVLTAGAVGVVAAAVIANEVNRPQPVYARQPYEGYYMPVRPHRPHCYVAWENTHRGYVERRVCNRY
jgi:hypothetical protein